MKYQDKIGEGMVWLGKQPKSVFVGEGLRNAGSVYGTLSNVPSRKCLEMPICENLIVGVSIGLSMQGFTPIVVFQRMDFMLIASDAIINHLALIPSMSGGQYPLKVILRTIVGSQGGKFEMGPQHNHDFTHIFQPYLKVVSIGAKTDALKVYKEAYASTSPTMVVERKDLYEPN